MLNSLANSEVKNRFEVAPHRDGYRGTITIPGWGTRHTSIVDTPGDATILLNRLKDEVFGSGSFNGGISDKQKADFEAALADKFDKAIPAGQ